MEYKGQSRQKQQWWKSRWPKLGWLVLWRELWREGVWVSSSTAAGPEGAQVPEELAGRRKRRWSPTTVFPNLTNSTNCKWMGVPLLWYLSPQWVPNQVSQVQTTQDRTPTAKTLQDCSTGYVGQAKWGSWRTAEAKVHCACERHHLLDWNWESWHNDDCRRSHGSRCWIPDPARRGGRGLEQGQTGTPGSSEAVGACIPLSFATCKTGVRIGSTAGPL